MYRASQQLSYERKPGFEAENVMNNTCIVVLQLFSSQTDVTQDMRFYVPRAYTNVKRVVLKRVDTISNTSDTRIMQFLNASHQPMFIGNQYAQEDNVTHPGFIVCTEKALNWIIGNWRDSDGRVDQTIIVKQAPAWDTTITDARMCITLELELAVWQ
jgi:hypothetical protein